MTARRFVLAEARSGRYRVEHDAAVDADAVLAAVEDPGVVLKRSHKFLTRRVGDWLLKSAAEADTWDSFVRWLRPAAARRPWRAAVTLWRAGAGVPRPVAHVDDETTGRSIILLEYLEGYATVEEHAARLVREGASPDAIAAFLTTLADALNALVEAGAWHADCSGKNILAVGAWDFRFIDLDAVALDASCTPRRRLTNHVQLYDSFCDLWDDAAMRPLFARLGPPAGVPLDAWMARVRAGQTVRRRRQIRRWNRQGQPRPSRPGDPPSA